MTVQGGGSREAEGCWFKPQCGQHMKCVLVAGEGARTSIEVPFSKVLTLQICDYPLIQIQMIQSILFLMLMKTYF